VALQDCGLPDGLAEMTLARASRSNHIMHIIFKI
jgi:hypothetical protein